ncbi:heme A synthase [Aestuariicella hydrocarbonica]|uniref:Heme A synthase n=1 Tax=Pseudomaricurvus hydrocarbonicus TaxID=1470433 RepID=A0A9E5MPI6_9GAMM|nr:COX15/CtaA family protein [Aestuariicella hydrocarbonica]NHO67958.1 heme A synthase [Aestuariicella hydrocarbonica]
MMSKRLSHRGRLTLLACALAFVVVALGAFTRLVDAGLGCPDWPGCYGHMTWPESSEEIQSAESLFPHAPVDTTKTWPEMVHRYFAGSLGLVILALAMMATIARRKALKSSATDPNHRLSGELRSIPVVLPWLTVGLVVLQAMFGMWTVTLKLWPQVVTAHLLGGFATLALLWLMFLRLRQRDHGLAKASLNAKTLSRVRKLAALGLVLVVLQIALGGWTSSNYAALACIDLPTCHGEWLPTTDFAQGFNFTQTLGPNYLGGLMDNEARTAIHLSHRIGALVVTLVVVLLSAVLWQTQARGLKRLALFTVGVLIAQVTLGMTNILAALPLPVAVLHNAVGALLLLTLVTVNYQLLRRCEGRDNAAARSNTINAERAVMS